MRVCVCVCFSKIGPLPSLKGDVYRVENEAGGKITNKRIQKFLQKEARRWLNSVMNTFKKNCKSYYSNFNV